MIGYVYLTLNKFKAMSKLFFGPSKMRAQKSLKVEFLLGLDGLSVPFIRPFVRLIVHGFSIALVGCTCLLAALLIQFGASVIFSHFNDARVLFPSSDAPRTIVLQAHPTMQVAPWGEAKRQNRQLLNQVMHSAPDRSAL